MFLPLYLSEVAASDESSADSPLYSAGVLTAALKVQKAKQEPTRTELQRLMEMMVSSQSSNVQNAIPRNEMYTETENNNMIQSDNEKMDYQPTQYYNNRY